MTIARRGAETGGVIVIMAAAWLCAAGCRKSSAATLEARDLFAATCARCHGVDGAGGEPSTDGGPTPRNFRDHAFQVSHTDEQIRATIKNGKGSMMPPFATVYTDEQIAGLATYVRGFDPTGGAR
jgi:mono/diheme cytochrome c family protein